MTTGIDVDALLRGIDLVDLVGKTVSLTKQGRDFNGLCPFHKERTPSFFVIPDKGFYHCFGCGAHGDAIDFVAHLDGVDFKEAARRLGAGNVVPLRPCNAGPPPAPVDLYAGYKIIDPPYNAPEMFMVGERTPLIFNPKRAEDEKRAWGSFVPSLVHPYRASDGRLLGFVLRRDFDVAGKRDKETPTIQYVETPDGEVCWARVPFREPRPLYGLDRLAANPHAQVILPEGEKACDAAVRMFPQLVDVTWPGGSNAYRKVDWSPLKGRRVLLLPDADEAGMRAMLGWNRESGERVEGIADLLLKAGAEQVKVAHVIG